MAIYASNLNYIKCYKSASCGNCTCVMNFKTSVLWQIYIIQKVFDNKTRKWKGKKLNKRDGAEDTHHVMCSENSNLVIQQTNRLLATKLQAHYILLTKKTRTHWSISTIYQSMYSVTSSKCVFFYNYFSIYMSWHRLIYKPASYSSVPRHVMVS